MRQQKEASSVSLDVSFSHSSSSAVTQQMSLSSTFSEQREMVGWSDLPVELLEKIVGNLNDIADRIKFGAICKRWLSALKSPILPRVRLPLLVISSEDGEDNKVLKFYSLSNNKTYSISHNLELMNCVCSSDSGWLLMADFSSLSGQPVYPLLFNPITGSRILLPKLPDSFYRTYVCNIIVSPKDESIVVMVHFLHNWLLWCYRVLLKSVEDKPPASSSWTSFSIRDLMGGEMNFTSQFTYHRGLYFISVGKTISTAIIDPDTNRVVSLIPPLAATIPRLPWLRYLVRSSTGDELFLVVEPSLDFGNWFEVFRWDSTEQQNRWSKVRSVGSDTIFKGPDGITTLLSLPSGNSNTFIRENCIVFFGRSESGGLRLSLFDIGDDTVEQLPYFSDLEAYYWSLHWFLPVM